MPKRSTVAFVVVVALLIAGVALPALAQPATGDDAFARQDYATAVRLWRSEAEAGSAKAKFGLGLANDLGLGVARDSAKALRWYLEAADAGMAEAQFNVAVMLDAGAGVPRDIPAATIWYSRAAANGNSRAEYNLGILYENGEGVPANPDLARYWLDLAAGALPAARERLASLCSDDR